MQVVHVGVCIVVACSGTWMLRKKKTRMIVERLWRRHGCGL